MILGSLSAWTVFGIGAVIIIISAIAFAVACIASSGTDPWDD
jgi:hypothetical protein